MAFRVWIDDACENEASFEHSGTSSRSCCPVVERDLMFVASIGLDESNIQRAEGALLAERTDAVPNSRLLGTHHPSVTLAHYLLLADSIEIRMRVPVPALNACLLEPQLR